MYFIFWFDSNIIFFLCLTNLRYTSFSSSDRTLQISWIFKCNIKDVRVFVITENIMDPNGDDEKFRFDRKIINPYADLGWSRDEAEKQCLELAKKVHPDWSQADERSRRRCLELVETWYSQTLWEKFKEEWKENDFTFPPSTSPPSADNISDFAPSSSMIIVSGIIGLGVSYFAAKQIGIQTKLLSCIFKTKKS